MRITQATRERCMLGKWWLAFHHHCLFCCFLGCCPLKGASQLSLSSTPPPLYVIFVALYTGIHLRCYLHLLDATLLSPPAIRGLKPLILICFFVCIQSLLPRLHKIITNLRVCLSVFRSLFSRFHELSSSCQKFFPLVFMRLSSTFHVFIFQFSLVYLPIVMSISLFSWLSLPFSWVYLPFSWVYLLVFLSHSSRFNESAFPFSGVFFYFSGVVFPFSYFPFQWVTNFPVFMSFLPIFMNVSSLFHELSSRFHEFTFPVFTTLSLGFLKYIFPFASTYLPVFINWPFCFHEFVSPLYELAFSCSWVSFPVFMSLSLHLHACIYDFQALIFPFSSVCLLFFMSLFWTS